MPGAVDVSTTLVVDISASIASRRVTNLSDNGGGKVQGAVYDADNVNEFDRLRLTDQHCL